MTPLYLAKGSGLAVGAYVGCYLLTLAVAALGLPAMAILVVILILWPAVLLWRVIALGPIDAAEAIFIVLLGASQNIALGFVTPLLDANSLKFLLTTNFLFAMLVLGILMLARRDDILHREVRSSLAILASLYAAILLSVAVVGMSGAATLASVRNLTSPLLLYAIGFLATWRREWTRTFQRAIVAVGILVVLFGVVERFLIPDLWLSLNITELWEKKELSNIGSDGLPRNWYSAERIGGEAIRRMASSFAEPVNLGTFLFLFFVAAIAERRPAVVLLSLAGILLAVSKGGMLGVMIFAAVASYVYSSRATFVIVTSVVGFLGVAFVLYSLEYATGSLLIHVTGFSNAFIGLADHPLGQGVGRVGRLAEQFVFLAEQDIAESGIGVIIGQLGLPGLAIYAAFITAAARRLSRLEDRLQRTIGLGLLFGATANIAFNEVGLSPNSTAGHFFWIGALAAVACSSRPPSRERMLAGRTEPTFGTLAIGTKR